MRLMKSSVKQGNRLLVLAVPLVLGFIGFTVVEKKPVSDGLFLTLCMYVLGYTDAPANIWIELARWTAPLATASGVILALKSLRDWLRGCYAYLQGNSVAVYGPEVERKAMLSQLRNGIEGKEAFVRAHQYLLLHDEKTNFAFYERHCRKLDDAQVFLKCSTLSAQSAVHDRLHLFCPEETAARLFWKENYLYPAAKACNYSMQVVLIGFGELGKNLLISGLQSNIFHPEQKISYHVFGDPQGFDTFHTQLAQISDPVIFHPEPWHQQLPLLEQAQMVLVLEQNDQPRLLDQLLLALCRQKIHVFSCADPQLRCMDTANRVVFYDWLEEAQKPAYIFDDILYERAKRINLRYAHLYNQVPQTPEQMELEWKKLDGFTRYSNIYAADYHELRLRMLQDWGWTPGQPLLDIQLEQLSHLEHIRWCRYHQLNNWKLGTPENGKNKDPQRKIHTCLIPYEELSEAEKEKDRENIRVMMSV